MTSFSIVAYMNSAKKAEEKLIFENGLVPVEAGRIMDPDEHVSQQYQIGKRLYSKMDIPDIYMVQNVENKKAPRLFFRRSVYDGVMILRQADWTPEDAKEVNLASYTLFGNTNFVPPTTTTPLPDDDLPPSYDSLFPIFPNEKPFSP